MKKKHKYIKIAVVGPLILFFTYCLLSFRIVRVDGESMQPTLMKGDYILINKFHF